MLKKGLQIVIVTLSLLVLCACDIEIGPARSSGEEHTYSYTMLYDENYHWHFATCEHTDQISGKAQHEFDEKYRCDCGYIKGHKVSGIFDISESGELNLANRFLCTGEKVIPSSIGGTSVTGINNSAFRGCDCLTSITIPDSVTSIGYEAFDGCEGLINIRFSGTKAQWWSVSGSFYCFKDVPASVVHCSDGDVELIHD